MFCPARTNVTDNVLEDWRGAWRSQNNCWNGKYCRRLEPRKKALSMKKRCLIDGFDKCRWLIFQYYGNWKKILAVKRINR